MAKRTSKKTKPMQTELGAKMAADWDARAERDPLHWTVNCVPEGQWQIEDYLFSGESTVRSSLDNFLENMAVEAAGKTVVEIGCGAGRVTAALARRFAKVHALDVSPKMVEATRQTLDSQGLTNVELFVGDGHSLSPLKDGCADVVYSVIVMQHIPDPDAQLAYVLEAARVLKAGGYFMLSFYADTAEYERLKPLWEMRRQVNDPLGWGELAALELPRYETSMSTPMPADKLYKTLDEVGLDILVERGQGTITWWVAGQKHNMASEDTPA